MRVDQFWQKASDFYNIHRGRYYHAILTDEELQATVTDYIQDTMVLIGEWYNTQGDSDERK